MPGSQCEQPVPLQQGIKKAPGTKPRCFHVISSHLISSHVMSCCVVLFRFVSCLSPSEKACPWRSRHSLAAWAYRWQLPSRSTGRCRGLANGHDAFWGLACSLFDVSASSALESCHLRSLEQPRRASLAHLLRIDPVNISATVAGRRLSRQESLLDPNILFGLPRGSCELMARQLSTSSLVQFAAWGPCGCLEPSERRLRISSEFECSVCSASRCSPRASELTALPVRPEPLAALMAHFLFALGVERRGSQSRSCFSLFCRAISADVSLSNFQYSEALTFPF